MYNCIKLFIRLKKKILNSRKRRPQQTSSGFTAVFFFYGSSFYSLPTYPPFYWFKSQNMPTESEVYLFCFLFWLSFFFGQYLAINSSIGFFPPKKKYWVWTGEMSFFLWRSIVIFLLFNLLLSIGVNGVKLQFSWNDTCPQQPWALWSLPFHSPTVSVSCKEH